MLQDTSFVRQVTNSDGVSNSIHRRSLPRANDVDNEVVNYIEYIDPRRVVRHLHLEVTPLIIDDDSLYDSSDVILRW